ncbi:MAG: MiaB/RimO family radical SAM methylthiotransferase [Candidatus Chisholmbacteria bacterium]|nr:MiaB/RimO family radical SAM methylthiotransferase [Candidatus Chisholmbacteria bacterium]
MPSYYIKTFGCQANKSDSERIAGDYEARGYSEAASWQEAGEIVVNTCAVRQMAEDRARGFLVNVAAYFSSRPRADGPMAQRPKIILTGCMTHHGNQKLYEMLPMVDEILPVGEVGFNQAAVRRDKVHAWVPVSTGCNSFCTFCIVPYSRGREKSRAEADILTEVKALAEAGYKEITLLGQNVNSWGLEKVGVGFRKLLMDKDKKLKLSDIPVNQSQYLKPNGVPPFVRLLRKVSEIKGIAKVRFITSNPWDFYDELIEEIADNSKIDRFIHLPVQSGSNRVLKLMNRGYSREDYLVVVEKIKKKIPDVALGTDIIVGFPGETEKDFEETVDLAKQVGWKVAFVARYSPRPGTAAWRIYADDIPPAEKKRRWEVLDELINRSQMSERPRIV